MNLDPVSIGKLRVELAATEGKVIPLVSDPGGECWLWEEKTRCTDATASGGNVALLSVAT